VGFRYPTHLFFHSLLHVLTTLSTTHYALYTTLYTVPHRDPLIYFEERADKDIRLAQRLPFFAAADVLMITATRCVVCSIYSIVLCCIVLYCVVLCCVELHRIYGV